MFTVIWIIQWISVLILGVESLYVFVNMRTKGQSYLFIFCLSAFINNATYLGAMTAKVSEEAATIARFTYLGKVWIPLSFLVLTMELCEVKIKKKIFIPLILFHLLVQFAALTSKYHNFFYTSERNYVKTGLLPHFEYGHAPLYNIYIGLMPVYVLIGSFILIKRMITDKDKTRQKMYGIIMLAVIFMTSGLVLFMLNMTGGYDSTSMGYALCAVLMAIAIFKYRLLDNLTLVKDYIVDTMMEGIILVDNRDKVIYFNNQMANIYPDVKIAPNAIYELIKNKLNHKELIERHDRIYEPTCNPLYRKDEMVGSLYQLTDVTAREIQLEEIRNQKDIAEDLNMSKTKFLNIVSHEIRTPMNAVVGMTELMLKDSDNLNETQLKYLKNIKASGNALVLIINDILDHSKLEAGKMELVEDSYELGAVIDEVRMIIENRIGDKAIDLIYDIEENLPKHLVGDSLRIRQILINLMNNAVKFTESGFIRLCIKTEKREEDRVQLFFCVEDSGQGIKESDLSRLYEAFAQVNTSINHKKEGTGLGLSISKGFIAMMGGQLEVSSVYHQGSKFYFTIWQTIDKEAELQTEEDLTFSDDLEFTASEARVLVVDDTEINLMIVEDLLEPLEMTVDTAISGKDAIELVKKNTYHAIFMDYMMPELDGAQTTKQIRSLASEYAYCENLPIIALSGDNSEEAIQQFKDAGMNDFAVKPVDPIRLNELMFKWLPKDLIVIKK